MKLNFTAWNREVFEKYLTALPLDAKGIVVQGLTLQHNTLYAKITLMRQRVAVFVIDGENVLLLHRFKNGKEYYAVPGGGVEPGETETQTAIREIKEETGLDIILGKKIGSFAIDDEFQFFYIAKSWSGIPKLGGPEAERNSPENSYELEWILVAKMGTIPFRKEIKNLLLAHLSLK